MDDKGWGPRRVETTANAADVIRVASDVGFTHRRTDGATATLTRGQVSLIVTSTTTGTTVEQRDADGAPQDLIDALTAAGHLAPSGPASSSAATRGAASLFAPIAPTAPAASLTSDAVLPHQGRQPFQPIVAVQPSHLTGPPTGGPPPEAVLTPVDGPAWNVPTGQTQIAEPMSGHRPLPPASPLASGPVGVDRDRSAAVRGAGLVAIGAGLAIILGSAGEVLTTGTFDSTVSGWPFLVMGLFMVLAGIDGMRGSRAGVCAAGMVGAGFAVFMAFVIQLLDLLSAMGSSHMTAGSTITILSWLVAGGLGALSAVQALALQGRVSARRMNPAVGLVTLAALAAVIGGQFEVGTTFSTKAVFTSNGTITAMLLSIIGILVIASLAAVFLRSAESHGLLAGAALFWCAVLALTAYQGVTGKSFSAASRTNLMLQLGGSAVLLAIGALGSFALSSPVAEPTLPPWFGEEGPSAPTTAAGLGAIPPRVTRPSTLLLALPAVLGCAGLGIAYMTSSKTSRYDAYSSSYSGYGYSGYASSGRTTTTGDYPYGYSSTTTDYSDFTTSTTYSRRTTTTDYETTTTYRQATTTTYRPTTTMSEIIGTISTPGCVTNCHIYRRSSPFDDVSKPASSYRIDGDRVTVQCKSEGQNVHSPSSGRSSTTWYKIDNGNYWVSAVYLSVSVSEADVPTC